MSGTLRLARARQLAHRLLPRPLIRRLRPSSKPLPGRVDFGDLRRTRPISRYFGLDRGRPVDRYYIERFLAANASDIRGRVLEVGDATYTRRYGGSSVTASDVLHVDPAAPGATIIADLAVGEGLPTAAFDCVILTQTLHLIYDFRSAVATLHRILAPAGVVLATVPGISQLDSGDWRDSWYWSFTANSAQRVFEERFGPGRVAVEASGNVLAAVAFLHGIASEELSAGELSASDASYPVSVTIRAARE